MRSPANPHLRGRIAWAATLPAISLLHWGLENQMMSAADFAVTPLQELIRPGSTLTRLDAFRAVRKFLLNGNPPVFDNNFTQRLQL